MTSLPFLLFITGSNNNGIKNLLFYFLIDIEMTVGGVDNFYLVYIFLGLGFIGSIFVWKFSHSSRAPNFIWVFSLIAFILSIGYIS